MVDLENPERNPQEEHRYIIWLESARVWIVLFAFLCAGIGLLANFLGVSLSTYITGEAPATTLNTALCILFLGIAICTSDNRKKFRTLRPIAVLATIICAGAPQAIDFMGLGGPFVSSGFGLDTSLIIVLLAISVQARFHLSYVGLWAGLAASALILNGVIGQSYGLPFFDGEMALMTLISLACIMVATASLYLHRPLIRVMFMSGSIGLRTRTMMAVGFLAPWGCGLLLYRWYGVPERAFHVEATLISAIIWIMFVVTLASGFSHEKADQERRRAERRLAQQALTDTLTQLPNRAATTARLSELWHRFHRFGESSAIVLVDLDHFKTINDTFGHDIGDKVLQSMRDAIMPYLRDDDLVGRWGGEEFICILRNTELQHLQRITERLRMSIRKVSDLPTLDHGKGRVNVSASFGISTLQKGDKGYTAAIKRADDALYVAKRNGRNRAVFDSALRASVLESVRMRNALRA